MAKKPITPGQKAARAGDRERFAAKLAAPTRPRPTASTGAS